MSGAESVPSSYAVPSDVCAGANPWSAADRSRLKASLRSSRFGLLPTRRLIAFRYFSPGEDAGNANTDNAKGRDNSSRTIRLVTSSPLGESDALDCTSQFSAGCKFQFADCKELRRFNTGVRRP